MKRCIEDHISLGLTTAISGTGKTLLTQVLLQELDPRLYQSILVLAYPGMSRTALLREILGELKIEGIPEKANLHKLVSIVQQYIVDQYMKGIRLVLIIDEVHFLQADALHMLRTLSNIEVPDNKLVTVLLFGEQVFLTKMKHPSFRSIFSRMFTRAEIRPLDFGEVNQYVKFRLMMSGGKVDLIQPEALELIYKNSGGIPREINRICHNALAIAAREGKKQVEQGIIRRIPATLPIQQG
ncbi:AAA family ATPase [Candidatus Sumerlaeota bacterium]|nr:AAA family ATPase [Candidatus Sumerlaeota bacterium]